MGGGANGGVRVWGADLCHRLLAVVPHELRHLLSSQQHGPDEEVMEGVAEELVVCEHLRLDVQQRHVA